MTYLSPPDTRPTHARMHLLPDRLEEGRPWPLGATYVGEGVQFAVFSAHATSVHVCLFEREDGPEVARYALHGPTDHVWHGFLPGVRPGLLYGYRASGPYLPEQGHRFNPHKLLLDPYAREIVGQYDVRPESFGYELGHPNGPSSFNAYDNAPHALKARIVAPPEPVAHADRPNVPMAEMVLYELHVKGFTRLHPGVPPPLRGTYAGLASPAALEHLKALGVTTLSLLPVQYRVDEGWLKERGLSNYWGYNTLGFFAVEPRYAANPDHATEEFRQMVETMHAHGIEVILDVVYNHTAEGNEQGPTLSFRGLDNASYYRPQPGQPARTENLSGTGNTLDLRQPRVVQLVLDSLRYWVQTFGVDGFRFDLATILGRGDNGFDVRHPFFVAVRQDPVLAGVKLIAEPWDVGMGGYQVGRFPGGWLEWNDRYRDAVRSFWLQRSVGRGEFARRFTASSDLFNHDRRGPTACINFVSCHDGFTLHDLVSYNQKHNWANSEGNEDGHNDNHSWNAGVEGPTHKADVMLRRRRLRRSLMATLLLSQGTPMLLAGDEIGQTQEGNNNAYCQDNPLTWLNWMTPEDDIVDFVSRAVALRKQFPQLRRAHWFTGEIQPDGQKDISWWAPDGREMTLYDWNDPGRHVFGCQFASTADAPHRLLMAFNAEPAEREFVLPRGTWHVQLDTGTDAPDYDAKRVKTVTLPPHSLLVLAQSVAA